MKQVIASIDSLPINLYILETLVDFREGARLYDIENNNGILFNFGKSQIILMENSSVPKNLCVLYFYKFSKYGIVQKIDTMKANTYGPYNSGHFYQICIEFTEEFVNNNNIKVGSILSLSEEI